MLLRAAKNLLIAQGVSAGHDMRGLREQRKEQGQGAALLAVARASVRRAAGAATFAKRAPLPSLRGALPFAQRATATVHPAEALPDAGTAAETDTEAETETQPSKEETESCAGAT